MLRLLWRTFSPGLQHLSNSALRPAVVNAHAAHTPTYPIRPPHGTRRFTCLNAPPSRPILPPPCSVLQVDGDEESEEEEDVGMGDIDVEAGPALTVDV